MRENKWRRNVNGLAVLLGIAAALCGTGTLAEEDAAAVVFKDVKVRYKESDDDGMRSDDAKLIFSGRKRLILESHKLPLDLGPEQIKRIAVESGVRRAGNDPDAVKARAEVLEWCSLYYTGADNTALSCSLHFKGKDLEAILEHFKKLVGDAKVECSEYGLPWQKIERDSIAEQKVEVEAGSKGNKQVVPEVQPDKALITVLWPRGLGAGLTTRDFRLFCDGRLILNMQFNGKFSEGCGVYTFGYAPPGEHRLEVLTSRIQTAFSRIKNAYEAPVKLEAGKGYYFMFFEPGISLKEWAGGPVIFPGSDIGKLRPCSQDLALREMSAAHYATWKKK